MEILTDITKEMIVGNASKVSELNGQALAEGFGRMQLISEALMPGMTEMLKSIIWRK